MYIKEVTEIPKRQYHKLSPIVDEFWNSELNMAEIIYNDSEYSNTNSFVGGLRSAIKSSHYGISVMKRKNRVFMVKDN